MTELADALSQLAATRAELHALINSCEPEALEQRDARTRRRAAIGLVVGLCHPEVAGASGGVRQAEMRRA